ncbi:MAG: hypothetical protein IJI14_08915 [Anaerolineaceae bacterium]|nr:hypothetical protein [Anaerolineaceae bacterium]
MIKTIRKNFLMIAVLALLLAVTTSAFAVSSVLYNEDGNNRLYLGSGNRFYVYVNEGDTVYVGTSSKSDKYDVRIIMPDLEKHLYKLNEISEGYIENRAQELAGPKPLAPDGYTPITATAAQQGYIEIVLYGSNMKTPNVSVDDPWEACSEGDCVTAAWDITVTDKDGNIRDGRVFSKKLFMSDVQTETNGLEVYALTEDGYLYQFNSGRINGGDWTISANNRGVIHMPTNKMIYSSVQNNKEFKRDYMIGVENFGRTVWMEEPKIISYTTTGYIKNGKIIRYDNPKEEILYEDPTVFDPGFTRSWYGDSLCRLFLEMPSEELLEYIGLTEPMPAPAAENVLLEKRTDGTYRLSFDSPDTYGVYELRITFSNDDNFKRTVSLGNYVSYENELEWDGNDNKGNPVGDEEFTAQLILKAGEIHFDIDDIEYIYDGIKIKNLNASESSKVYYDNEEAVIDGSRTWINVLHCNDEEQKCRRVKYIEDGSLLDAENDNRVLLLGKITKKKGVDSYKGICMKTDYGYSDGLMMDIWSYDPEPNIYDVIPTVETDLTSDAAETPEPEGTDIQKSAVAETLAAEITEAKTEEPVAETPAVTEVISETESISETISETPAAIEETQTPEPVITLDETAAPVEITAESIEDVFDEFIFDETDYSELPFAVVVQATPDTSEGEWFVLTPGPGWYY